MRSVHDPGRPTENLGPGTLFLVPTPIGNLEDITLRAIRILREADWVVAEDTRRAQVLFQAHDIRRPVRSHHAHNEHRETPALIRRLLAGESGALITDAGAPGISDPGFLLAREARARAVPVQVLPGPSAVVTAVVASGFPPVPFVFEGYLPPTAGRRLRWLQKVREEPRTVVGFETPHRIERCLEQAVEVLGERPIALLREMTKLHEQVLRGTAAELLGSLSRPPRGEITLVFAPLGRSNPREPAA